MSIMSYIEQYIDQEIKDQWQADDPWHPISADMLAHKKDEYAMALVKMIKRELALTKQKP